MIFIDKVLDWFFSSTYRELLEVKHEDEKLKFKLSGYVTNANYSTKKLTFLLFINRKFDLEWFLLFACYDCFSLNRVCQKFCNILVC